MRRILDGELGVRCAFLPFKLLIGWASFAVVLFYSCKAWGKNQPIRFVQFLSLEVHAESALVLAQIAICVMALFDGSERLLLIPLGLDRVRTGPTSFLSRTLLNAVNPFTAWYLVILSSGAARLCGFRRIKAALITLSVHVLNLAFSIVSMVLFQETFHLGL